MNAVLLLLLVLIVLGGVALQIWFVVISVRFLRSGRKAFDRYVETHPGMAPVNIPQWTQRSHP